MRIQFQRQDDSQQRKNRVTGKNYEIMLKQSPKASLGFMNFHKSASCFALLFICLETRNRGLLSPELLEFLLSRFPNSSNTIMYLWLPVNQCSIISATWRSILSSLCKSVSCFIIDIIMTIKWCTLCWALQIIMLSIMGVEMVHTFGNFG